MRNQPSGGSLFKESCGSLWACSFSVPRTSSEEPAFLDAAAYAQRCTPLRQNIINGSIASAVVGAFGAAISRIGPAPASCSSTR